MGPVPGPQSPFDLATTKFEEKCHQLQLECGICLGPYRDVTRIECGHKLCKLCVETIMQPMHCPECRKEFTAQTLEHDFGTQGTIDSLWKQVTDKAGLKDVKSPYAHVEVKHADVKKAAANAPINQPQHNNVNIIEGDFDIEYSDTFSIKATNVSMNVTGNGNSVSLFKINK